MSTYEPHLQLKKIRQLLGKTQPQFAEMLGISYPYFLSVETGQRNLSGALARKLTWFLGLTLGQIQVKRAKPMFWDADQEKMIPFTKEGFQKYSSRRPAFRLRSAGGQIVTPEPKEYARALRALLESAEEQGRIAEVLAGFFDWFSGCISTDVHRTAFDRKYRKIYPKGDNSAKQILIDYRREPKTKTKIRKRS